ncbi:cysteine--tRNA ligase [Sphingomonas turrisvirgatae]|nr:cysteine--tRNA ligase [Sphingomonas turrisvirgatae]
MTGASLTLYNSFTRSLEPFAPIDLARGTRVYSCGPTVYSDPHLGNLRAYVFTDTLSRTLRWKGYPLTHVINITDVGHLTSDADAGEDKMEKAAKARGQSAWDISRHYADVFRRNLADLNIAMPDHMPLATDYVPAMIEFARGIEQHCYALDSGLYFDSTTVPDYGKLSGGQDDAGEGRIESVVGKRHPQDFAIWRNTPPGETRQMEWDSPWGRGAPGWHLECSVMSAQLLGLPFDIHTGGIDHREIHHVNEIAQNQAHCNCADSGARIWMHNNFLVDRGGKMSKSKGGIATLDALVAKGVHPLAYRLMCLSAHYRSELEFSGDNLLAALVRLRRLVLAAEKFRTAEGKGKTDASSYLERLDAAVSEDLNTPRALPVLEELLADKQLAREARLATLEQFDAVLGLNLAALTRADLRVRPADAQVTDAEIEARLAQRKEARAAKDFARSDAIRDELLGAGVEVMDGDPLGWDWKVEI